MFRGSNVTKCKKQKSDLKPNYQLCYCIPNLITCIPNRPLTIHSNIKPIILAVSHNSCPSGPLNFWQIFWPDDVLVWEECRCLQRRQAKRSPTDTSALTRPAPHQTPVTSEASRSVCSVWNLFRSLRCKCLHSTNVGYVFFYDPEMCVCSSECVEGWWRLIYRHQQECETCHRHQVLVLKLGTRLILSAVCACYVFSRCMLVCKCQVMLNIFASIFFSQFSLFQNCNARLQIASALISKREYDNHNGKLDTLLLPFFSFFGEGKRGNNTLRLSSAVSIC